MSVKIPFVVDDTTGIPRAIAAGDTIDPQFLPSSSGAVPVNISTSVALAANSNYFARIVNLSATGVLAIPADTILAFV